jgi:hypothetical protein
MINAIPYVGRSRKEREEKEAKDKQKEEKKMKIATNRKSSKTKSPERKKPKPEAPHPKIPVQPAPSTSSDPSDPVPSTASSSVPKQAQASYYVHELTRTIKGTNCNTCITTDNWFSSIPLFKEMLAENVTMVGTMRKNKKEIPQLLLSKQEEGSSIFMFDKTKAIVSHCPKKNQNVILMSTNGLFYNKGINQDSGKPEMIHFYNSTKGGTDTFDYM